MSTELSIKLFNDFCDFFRIYKNNSIEDLAASLDLAPKNFRKWENGFPKKGQRNSSYIVSILFHNTKSKEFESKTASDFIEYLIKKGYDINIPNDINEENFITFFSNFKCGMYSKKIENSFTILSTSESEAKNSLLSTIVELDKDDVFIGRDALIDDIHSAFEAHPTIFLYGIGGIGKSELAKQYYHKYKSYYNKVIFARYNREKTFATLLANDQIFKIQGVSRKIKNVNGNEETQSDDEYALEKMDWYTKSAVAKDPKVW